MTLMINGQIPGSRGRAVVPFAAWLHEDSVAIVGQSYIKADSQLAATIIADNDDVYAQEWDEPIIRDIVPGTGFTITLRAMYGAFKGNVKVDWLWR
jgi:hypothetical protein